MKRPTWHLDVTALVFGLFTLGLSAIVLDLPPLGFGSVTAAALTMMLWITGGALALCSLAMIVLSASALGNLPALHDHR